MADANFLLNCVTIAVFIAAGGLVLYARLHPSESHVEKAFKQFLATDIPSSNPKYAFNGGNARIVRKRVEQHGEEDTVYVLTIHARNPSGEYFSFRSDGGKPVVRHVEHRIAKIVLKDNYIPPPE